ncbi:MAG: phytanoyl-CoA dioxygenase [Halieaceae bacterium]|nr:phytanoyl-CoA dioxygenase [Halieaceae bacterium]
MIPKFGNTEPVSEVVAALRTSGAAIVSSAVSQDLMEVVAAELRSGFDSCALTEQSAFDGGKTNRFNQVLRASSGAAELVEHDWVIAVADEILLPHCANYTIGSMTAIEILPGEDGQALHRDDTIYPIDLAGLELQIGVMWAISDFNEENGATRVVPGSHRYLRSWHLPNLGEWQSAEMSSGSVLFYLGSTWHGGGANLSQSSRIGLINTYCLGWLRQESNQYFENPPHVARHLSPSLRALLGYTPHGSGDDELGTFVGECDGWLDTPPRDAWRDERGQLGEESHVTDQMGS